MLLIEQLSADSSRFHPQNLLEQQIGVVQLVRIGPPSQVHHGQLPFRLEFQGDQLVDLFNIEKIHHERLVNKSTTRVVIQASRQPWLDLKDRLRSGTELRHGSQFRQSPRSMLCSRLIR